MCIRDSLKYSQFNYSLIILILVTLILLPLILSRVLVEKDWDNLIMPHKGMIIDCCFFIVFYTVAAKTKGLVADWSYDMSAILIIAAVSVLLVFFIFRKVARLLSVTENKITSLLLLSTMKNYGMAGGLALLMFSEKVAFAALAFAVINFFYTNWLAYRKNIVRKSIVIEETPPS